MSKILDKIFEWIDETEEPVSGEEAVISALEKALDATTPERAGCPWDERKDGDEKD